MKKPIRSEIIQKKCTSSIINNSKVNKEDTLKSTMSESRSKTQRLNDESEDSNYISKESDVTTITFNKKGGGMQELLFVIIFLLILIYI